MRKIFIVLFLVLSYYIPLKAQNTGFILGTRVQLSTGPIFVRSTAPELEVTVFGESYNGFQQSLQASIFVQLKYCNLGIGSGLSLRTGDIIFNSTLSPKVFMFLEVKNGLKRSLLSFILNAGIMQGSIEKKGCFYLGGGPSFNIGKEVKKINVSINPYIEFHMGENGVRYYDDPHAIPGYPPNKYPYTIQFRTVTINLSCIVQFNFCKRSKVKA